MNLLKMSIRKIRIRAEKKFVIRRINRVKNTKLEKYGIVEDEKQKNNIVVSLTTFPARIGSVSLCIKSLLLQTVKPDKIILYLGSDISEEMIPFDLIELEKFGLIIVRNCENIKPHKKYYYAMKSYPKSMIVTVDDDIVYEKTLIEDLLLAHKKFPKAIICRRANVITRNVDNKIIDYRLWPACEKKKMKERFDLLPTGAGGVLYPPECISKMAFQIEDIKSYCLDADDVWLRFMRIKRKTPVVYCAPPIRYLAVIPGSQENALYKTNVQKNKNDDYIKIMEEHYGWSIDGK